MTWSVGAGLEGKGVIVTGAPGGIGKAVAEAFATTGARVMAVDLDQAKVDEVWPGFEGSRHLAWPPTCVTSRPTRARRSGAAELGNLYVLANLAAVLRRRGSVDEVTEEDWDFQHDVNLKAAFFLCRAAGERDDRAGQGRPDHPVQLAGLVDRRLRRVGRLRGDEGWRHHDVPRARPHVRAAPHHRSTACRPARSTRRC